MISRQLIKETKQIIAQRTKREFDKEIEKILTNTESEKSKINIISLDLLREKYEKDFEPHYRRFKEKNDLKYSKSQWGRFHINMHII